MMILSGFALANCRMAQGSVSVRISRRRFITRVPAAMVAVPTAATAVPSGISRTARAGATVEPLQGDPTPAIGADDLKCAERITGLRFTDGEDAMVVPGANRNRSSYETLRQLEVPLDTEPAITFRPYLPGTRPQGRSTRGARL